MKSNKLTIVGMGLGMLLTTASLVRGSDPQDYCSGGDDGGQISTGDGAFDLTREDPISMSTGAFTEERVDITLPGVVPIVYSRRFDSSLGIYNGPVGFDWIDNAHDFIRTGSFGSLGMIYFRNGVANILSYTDGYHSTAVSGQRPFYTAVTDLDTGIITISDKFGNKQFFAPNLYNSYQCHITKTVDRNGNEILYNYNSVGGLVSIEDPVDGRFLAFGYDGSSRISTITDNNGRQWHFHYQQMREDSLWYVLTGVNGPATDDFPYGRAEHYHYTDGGGMIEHVSDGKGNTTVQNVYNSGWQVITQTTLGQTSHLTYEESGGQFITHLTDNCGNQTDYYSDGNKNITKYIVHTRGLHSGEPSAYETDYEYTGGGALPGAGGGGGSGGGTSPPPLKKKETYPKGNGTSWTYDDNGNMLTETRFAPTGASVDSTKGTQVTTFTTTYTYESRFNQVASKTDPNGNVTTFDYGDATTNPKGNLLEITYPATAAGTKHEKFTYNSKGQVLTDTILNGTTTVTVTQNDYDTGTGFLSQTIKDYGTGKINATTNYTYDVYGHIATVQDPNGVTTTTVTDEADLVTEVHGPDGQVELRSYDENKNLVASQKQAPGTGIWEKVTYILNDDQQITASRKYTGGSSYLATTYAYDDNGNLTTVTDPLSHTSSTAYDERGKAYLMTDAIGHTVRYDFDGNGNVSKFTDELTHATTYEYDVFDRLQKKSLPDSSYQTYIYDKNGNATGLRTTAGSTIVQTFDEFNRKLTQNYGTTITNTYDIQGLLLTSTENSTALAYSYDVLGRNLTFTDQAGRTSTYTYDANGQRLNSTYPTGVVVKRAYDASNRLYTLKDNSNATMATFSYDILDRTTGISMANGTSVSTSYDLLNRPAYVNNTLGGSATRNYSYVYDNASRVTSTTSPRGAIATGYTDRSEVNSVTEPSGSPFADQSLSYDYGFNRSSWTLGATTTSYTANNLNQYTAVGATSPTWNSDGGLATYDGNTYTYDALMRLTEVDNSTNRVLFSYDPLGRRTKKVVKNASGSTTLGTYEYHYDGSEAAVEYQPSSVAWTYYISSNIDQPLMRTDGTTKQWYYRDGHGSVSAVANNSGSVLESYEYDVEGQFQITNGSNTVISSTGIGNFLMYTGREYDLETGNYFYRARYYSTKLGRFISRDPLSGAEFSQGTNLYAYCQNNYTNCTDPTGLFTPTAKNGDPIANGQQKPNSCVPYAVRVAIYKLTGVDVPEEQIRDMMAAIHNAMALGLMASGAYNEKTCNLINPDTDGFSDADAGNYLNAMGLHAAGSQLWAAPAQLAMGDVVFGGYTDSDNNPHKVAITSMGLAGYTGYDGHYSGNPLTISPGSLDRNSVVVWK